MGSIRDRSEIVFFDLETTIPTRPGQAYAILEFGSILVCPKKLNEVDSYVSLVRPLDLSLITALSVRANGITVNDVVSKPTFSEIADTVYNILHGRIWAGHNILRFDCVRLKEAYARINKPAPEPKGTIDTLTLLTQRFGRRAGDMKMASLAAYFGLGQQSHRSLDDVRMNLEVFKRCAAVLFLESTQEDIPTENNLAPPSATNYRSNDRTTLEGTGSNTSPFVTQPGPFHPNPIVDRMDNESIQTNEAMIEESSTTTLTNTEFINQNEVCMPSITISIAPFFHGPHKIQMLHKNIPMQIHCDGMRIRFGLSTQFVDHAGRQKLSFVVDANNNSNLCGILDACDNIAKRVMVSDNNSQWRPVVSRNPGFYNSPTIRLHLPSVAEDTTRLITEIYQLSSTQQLVSCRYDVAELDSLIRPGSLVDAYFSLDPYNYQQNAGIRLIAKKLIVHV